MPTAWHSHASLPRQRVLVLSFLFCGLYFGDCFVMSLCKFTPSNRVLIDVQLDTSIAT